jgi:hypothetical protein
MWTSLWPIFRAFKVSCQQWHRWPRSRHNARHNATGRFEAYQALLALAGEEWLDGHYGRVVPILDRIEALARQGAENSQG